jgi:hypothetical protein
MGEMLAKCGEAPIGAINKVAPRVLPKSHHLAGRATTPSPVVREPARAEKAYRTTAVKKKSRFRTSPVNTG